MKQFTLFSLLVIVLFFSSCQKGLDYSIAPDPEDSTSFLVKTYTEDIHSADRGNSVTTFNLTYDASNRITSMVSVSSPGNKTVYQYNSNNSFTIDIYNQNVLSIHQLLFVNSLSLVDSTFQYNDENDSSTEKYLYDGLGQLVNLKEYDYTAATGATLYNEHIYTYDSNGNQLSDTDNDFVTTVEYNSNLLNNLMIGRVYYFKSKNLPVKTTITSGSLSDTATHVYTFDDKKRITSETITAGGGDIYKRIYTY